VARLITLGLNLVLAAHLLSCSGTRLESKNVAIPEASPSPTGKTLPDMSQARDYFIYHSNIRLRQVGKGQFYYDPTLLEVVGNLPNVTIGTPDVGSLTADQRAHTAIKAALDIQRATRAEAILLYLSLGEDLPKISYSVAAVAYAPSGKDWNDGAGVQVWDVEVSDVKVKSEAIRLAIQARQAGSDTALPIPTIYRRDYVADTPAKAASESSLDAQLFELLDAIIVEGEREHPYTVEAAGNLIERGANVNARDHGQTPFLRAAQNGHLQVMRLLMEHGADIDAQDDDGRTALMIAAGAADPEMVRLLLERGAKVNLKAKDGFTAWTGSQMADGGDPRYQEMRRLLKRAGAR
jgi:hypothetical protein